MATNKGAYRVGTDFNPSGDETVNAINHAAATFINLIEEIPVNPNEKRAPEVARLKALAQTEMESAAMWAVKAATKPDPG